MFLTGSTTFFRKERMDKAVTTMVPGTSCSLGTTNSPQQPDSMKPSAHGPYSIYSNHHHLDHQYPSNSVINEPEESTWRTRGCGSHYINSKVQYIQPATGSYADTNYYGSEVDQNHHRQFYPSAAHLSEGGQYYNGGSYHHHYHQHQHQSHRHQHHWHQPLTSLEGSPSSASCTLHYNYNYCDQAQVQQQYQQENDHVVRSVAYYQPQAPPGQQQQCVQENYNHTYHHHHQLQQQQASSVCYSGRQNSSINIAPPIYEQDHRHLTDLSAFNCHATELVSPSANIDTSRLSQHKVHLQVWLSAGCEQQTGNQKSTVAECPVPESTTPAATPTTAVRVQDGAEMAQDDDHHLGPAAPTQKQAKVSLVSKANSRLPIRSRVSTSPKINQCPVCERNYARPSTLKTHLRTHTNERPFQCNVCLKTFSQAANLTAHQRVHTGERPFSCPICHRRFSQSSSVITHLRTHSGERPYRCGHCSRTFSDSSTLTKHCRIHSGEKPYQCEHCPLNFSQSGNLSRHMKLHQTRPDSTNNSSSSSSNSSGSVGDVRSISSSAVSSSRLSSARFSSTTRSKPDTIQLQILNIQNSSSMKHEPTSGSSRSQQ